MIKNVLIMAAGRGMRLVPLTDQIAKPLIKINNIPLISLVLRQVIGNIPNVGITVGHIGGELANYVIESGVNNVFNTKGKGNAWWIFFTLMKYLDEPVLVLTCDNIVELDLLWIYGEYVRLGSPYCMIVPVKPVKGIDGDFIFQERGRILKLSRELQSDIYASGIQVLNPVKLNLCMEPEQDFNMVWNKLLEKNMLFCSDRYMKPWFSINTYDQLNLALKNFTL